MTTNLKQRIFTVIVGTIVVISTIILLPQQHYLAFCILLCIASFLGSYEMSQMLFGTIEPVVFFAWLLPFTQYIEINFNLPEVVPDLILVFEFFCLFTSEIFFGEKDNFEISLLRTAKGCLIIIYPSYFVSYLVKVAGLELAGTNSFALYFILVFGNDISAYVFGMLFGRKNAGIIKVSPKKSIAGFAGSFITTMTLAVLLTTITDKIWIKAIMGFLVSFAANVGDLIESVFKRSAKIKDSGNLFPGRGGMLDCLDSVCAAGPIYYLMLRLIMEIGL